MFFAVCLKMSNFAHIWYNQPINNRFAMKDICCLGHITKDKIITPRKTVYMSGGTSFYFSYAFNSLPHRVPFRLVTKLGEEDMDAVRLMRGAGIDVEVRRSRHTVYFENKYGDNQNERTQRVLEKADPFTVEDVSGLDAGIYHLGSLLADDFSPEVVEECAHLLDRSRCVLLFGLGSSLLVAHDIYLKLLRLDKPCVVNDDWHSQLLSARNATPADVGIAISYSGQTAEVIECMKALKANGVPTIAITRYSPSRVAELADYKLYIAANESLFRNGAMSSRIAQLNAVDILYTAYASLHYEDTLRALTRTHVYKPTPSADIGP